MLNTGWIGPLSSIAAAWMPEIVVSSAKATVVLAIAVLLLRLARHAAASFRHFVWFVAITSPVALTVLPHVLPKWHSGLPGTTILGWLSGRVDTSPVDARTHAATGRTARGLLTSSSTGHKLLESQLGNQESCSQSAELRSQAAAVPKQRIPTHVWLLIVWSAGVILLSAQTIIAHFLLWTKCLATERKHDSNWKQILDQCANQCGVRHSVLLTFSDSQPMPMACGIFAPEIVLPAEASHWSTERRRVVLHHELAHVARRDCLTSLIARLICVFHWFNPFLWGALRMMNNERERACDDLALENGVRASTYAEQVLYLAARFGKRASLCAGLSMARPSQLEGRLVAILDVYRKRSRLSSADAFKGGACVWMAIFPLAMAVSTQGAGSAHSYDERRRLDDRSEDVRFAQNDDDKTRVDAWTPGELRAALRSTDSIRRRQAKEAIRRVELDHATVRGLIVWLLEDLESDDSSLRKQAAWDLSNTGNPNAVAGLVARLDDEVAGVRAASAGALGSLARIAHPAALIPLLELLQDTSGSVRAAAAGALGSLGDADAVEPLIDALEDDLPDVRQFAARSLEALRDRRAVEPLLLLLDDKDRDVRQFTVRALSAIGDRRTVTALVARLDDEDRDVRQFAVRALGQLGDRRAVEPVMALLADDDADVREWAARTLGSLGDPRAIDALKRMLEEDNPDVARWAAVALNTLHGS